MIRILADQQRSLDRRVRTNRYRDVSNTSTSSCSSQQERLGRIAEEHGTGPRMV